MSVVPIKNFVPRLCLQVRDASAKSKECFFNRGSHSHHCTSWSNLEVVVLLTNFIRKIIT